MHWVKEQLRISSDKGIKRRVWKLGLEVCNNKTGLSPMLVIFWAPAFIKFSRCHQQSLVFNEGLLSKFCTFVGVWRKRTERKKETNKIFPVSLTVVLYTQIHVTSNIDWKDGV